MYWTPSRRGKKGKRGAGVLDLEMFLFLVCRFGGKEGDRFGVGGGEGDGWGKNDV